MAGHFEPTMLVIFTTLRKASQDFLPPILLIYFRGHNSAVFEFALHTLALDMPPSARRFDSLKLHLPLQSNQSYKMQIQVCLNERVHVQVGR